ncbi:uncharacterized protein TRUGW13939_00231 [Talaromyces rugulosus]|uniref:VOC domain-containing protein n=1 Tax=Talaromyces rugulosus TaxID=121627 RepID=A0A7H8QIA0_TALRU|nr:uncharacterized protein TRUGW13939_00231 [Talaromyces rugulosus]QKX53155.1 hypothetical protein TRUGW13939_00231 [Talaromyces rugulosus]
MAAPAVGSLFAVEIPVTNIERSIKFYSELFAWEFAGEIPKGVENIKSLHFFSDASKSIKGALMLLDEGHLPKTAGKEEWAVYSTFVVADVGETLKKAESLGGSIRVHRTELPNGLGVAGHVVDPDSNVLGVWSQK